MKNPYFNALLRRSENFNTEVTELTSNDISIRLLKGEVYKQGKLLELTASEYKLLCFFMENPDQVLSAEQILGKLWDCNENYIDNNSLTVYIRRLRTKIEDNPGEPKRIVTVRGIFFLSMLNNFRTICQIPESLHKCSCGTTEFKSVFKHFTILTSCKW